MKWVIFKNPVSCCNYICSYEAYDISVFYNIYIQDILDCNDCKYAIVGVCLNSNNKDYELELCHFKTRKAAVKRFKKIFTDLEAESKELKDMILFSPNGPVYQHAKQHFESC